MSNEKMFRAKLPKYQGPLFPTNIGELQTLLYDGNRTERFTGEFLTRLGKEMPGFVGISCTRTSDDYAWFWSMDFKLGEEKVSILFPWGQDLGKKDGTSADRHVAAYICDGDTDRGTTKNVIDQILNAINSLSPEKPIEGKRAET